MVSIDVLRGQEERPRLRRANRGAVISGGNGRDRTRRRCRAMLRVHTRSQSRPRTSLNIAVVPGCQPRQRQRPVPHLLPFDARTCLYLRQSPPKTENNKNALPFPLHSLQPLGHFNNSPSPFSLLFCAGRRRPKTLTSLFLHPRHPRQRKSCCLPASRLHSTEQRPTAETTHQRICSAASLKRSGTSAPFPPTHFAVIIFYHFL